MKPRTTGRKRCVTQCHATHSNSLSLVCGLCVHFFDARSQQLFFGNLPSFWINAQAEWSTREISTSFNCVLLELLKCDASKSGLVNDSHVFIFAENKPSIKSSLKLNRYSPRHELPSRTFAMRPWLRSGLCVLHPRWSATSSRECCDWWASSTPRGRRWKASWRSEESKTRSGESRFKWSVARLGFVGRLLETIRFTAII